MTPEELRTDLAERVRALEGRMSEVQSEQAAGRSEQAAMRREIEALRQLVTTLIPVGERTAVLVSEMHVVKDNVARVEKSFDARWGKLEAEQVASRRDSRSLRNILIGVGVAAVLSPVFLFLFTGAMAKP